MFPLVCGTLETVCFVQTRSILTLVSIIRPRGVAVVKMYTMVRKRVLALKISYGTKRCSWPLEEAIGWFVFPKSDCKTWIRGHGLREDRTGIGDSGFAC